MRNKVWLPLILAFVAFTFIMGCVATTQMEETATVDTAREDSLAEARRDSLLRLNRMFAYDKLRTRDWDNARRYLWQVVELDVNLEYNEWDRLYQTYTETGDHDSAQVVLRMGLEMFPSDAYLNATLGYYLKQTGQYAEAQGHYETAIESEADNTEYLRNLAEIYENQGMGIEAIATYRHLAELLPDDMEIQDRLTSVIREYQSPEEYLSALQQYVAENPEDLIKRQELLAAYVDQQMNEQVIAEADEIISRSPNDVNTYNAKAQAQLNLNQQRAAIATYEALLEVAPTNTHAMLQIADSHRNLGNFRTARTWIMRVREQDAGNDAATYMLGRIYESCADACTQGRGLEYDDKLVFIIAYGLFENAANGDDYTAREQANRRKQYMESFIPAYSDWFMNQSKELPQADCYGWINANWPEVRYIATFLNNLSNSR